MTQQAELWKKELGQNRVEQAHEDWILLARREAVRICARRGSVSAVDVHRWAERSGIHPDKPSAYSAVFRGKEWQPTGQYQMSEHDGGHARRVMVWRYESTVRHV